VYEHASAARDTARTLAAVRRFYIGRAPAAVRKRPTTGWEALTPSGLEVVRLAARALTDPDVGHGSTVQTHLAHAFRKLGITTRTQLAAEAAKRGAV
jgi:DNA-binding NarL/FixJ family response regulator